MLFTWNLVFVHLPYPNCELANQKPCLLSWFSTISSHWPDILRYHGQFVKLAFFLQTLEAKITTEIQRNVKLLHLLNEKVICLTVREGKNTISRQNWKRLHWRALAWTYGQRWDFFGFKMEPDFPNFFLNLDFQDSENKTPNKRIK